MCVVVFFPLASLSHLDAVRWSPRLSSLFRSVFFPVWWSLFYVSFISAYPPQSVNVTIPFWLYETNRTFYRWLIWIIIITWSPCILFNPVLSFWMSMMNATVSNDVLTCKGCKCPNNYTEMVLHFIHTEDESRLNSMHISNFVCRLHPPANSKGISLSHLSRQGRQYWIEFANV